MRKVRKNYSAMEKVAILRKHLIDKVPVSDICDDYQLQPTVFYRWQKELFENGQAAFEPKPGKKRIKKEQQRIAKLEAKLRKKDEVLGELMEEHVALKKSHGEL
jgi:transposase-like protein